MDHRETFSLKEVRAIFEVLNHDPQKLTMTYSEFQNALRSLNVEFDTEEFESVVRYLDRNNGGFITVEDFYLVLNS